VRQIDNTNIRTAIPRSRAGSTSFCLREVERLARRARKSQSEVFSAALREYVARHAPDEVTEAMNAVCDDLDDSRDRSVAEASRKVLENSEW
jgi:metal-responsive CopG/Arc/MetJ family transcriptional regulator